MVFVPRTVGSVGRASAAGRIFRKEVGAARGAYGYLAAVNPTGKGFFSQEHSSLRAYAQFAAAALDSVIALEAAQALLELSNSLEEVTSVDDVGMRLVRTMPKVLDCDRAIV